MSCVTCRQMTHTAAKPNIFIYRNKNKQSRQTPGWLNGRASDCSSEGCRFDSNSRLFNIFCDSIMKIAASPFCFLASDFLIFFLGTVYIYLSLIANISTESPKINSWNFLDAEVSVLRRKGLTERHVLQNEMSLQI